MNQAPRWSWALLTGLACLACFGAAEPDDSEVPAGTSGAPPCNDLELLDVGASCMPPGPVRTHFGGQIPDGVYAMGYYEMGECTLEFEETLRFTRTSDTAYDFELVLDVTDTRTSGVAFTRGTNMTTTLTCGGSPVPRAMDYSVLEVPERGVELRLSDTSGVYVYTRVGD